MLRAAPGWRRMWPRRSSVRTIWCTEGGLSWKWPLHVGLGRGTAVDAGIGVDEGQAPCLSVKLFADMAELGQSVDSLGRCQDNGSMRALPLCSKDFYIPG